LLWASNADGIGRGAALRVQVLVLVHSVASTCLVGYLPASVLPARKGYKVLLTSASRPCPASNSMSSVRGVSKGPAAALQVLVNMAAHTEGARALLRGSHTAAGLLEVLLGPEGVLEPDGVQQQEQQQQQQAAQGVHVSALRAAQGCGVWLSRGYDGATRS